MLSTCSVKFTYQRRALPGTTATTTPPVIRRGSVSSPVRLSNVVALARQLYTIEDKLDIGLTWKDEDDDVVTMSTEIEFDEYLQFLNTPIYSSQRQPPVLKFGLLVKGASRPTVPIIIPTSSSVVQCTETNVKKMPPVSAPTPVMVTSISPSRSAMLTDIRSQNALCTALSVGKANNQPEREVMLKKTALIAKEAASTKWNQPSPFKTAALKETKVGLSTSTQSFASNPSHNLTSMLLQVPHAVTPGSTFTHTWLIENNDSHDANDLYLKFDSGTFMRIAAGNPEYTRLHHFIGTIKAGKSKKIMINLVAPLIPGSYTSYFTLMTKNGMKVGPVLEVRTCHKLFPNMVPSVDQLISVRLKKTPSPTLNNKVTAETVTCKDNVPLAPPAPVAVAYVKPTPLERQCKAWASELAVLADMGFCDFERNIPLLQKHVKQPSRAAENETSNISNYALNEIVHSLLKMDDWKQLESQQASDIAVLHEQQKQTVKEQQEKQEHNWQAAPVQLKSEAWKHSEESIILDVGSCDENEEDDDFVILLGDGDHY